MSRTPALPLTAALTTALIALVAPTAQAARIGRAAFLLPEARTVPPSARPPSMTKDCIARGMVLGVLRRSVPTQPARYSISSLAIALPGSKPRT